MISIADLTNSGGGRLLQVSGDSGHRRRLLEMGFVPGTPVRLVRRADVGGVLELELRGCRVTLRTVEAQQILVDPD